MVTQSTLKSFDNSRKSITRCGRGNASGRGSFCGRGVKGQNSRSGAKFNAAFEGGQTPLFRRLPKKRGFTSQTAISFYPLNLWTIADLVKKGVTEITPSSLVKAGILSSESKPVKLLSAGDSPKGIKISVHASSKAAVEKVNAAGGSVDIIAL